MSGVYIWDGDGDLAGALGWGIIDLGLKAWYGMGII